MTLRDQVIAALKKVYDPEMPVNIYELGLIYGCEVDDAGLCGAAHDFDRAQLPGGRLAAGGGGAGRACGAGSYGREAGTHLRSALVERAHEEAAKLALGIEDIIPIARLRR